MATVDDVIQMAKGAKDRAAVYAQIETLARETFPDESRATAIVKTLDRYPELSEAYYAAPAASPTGVEKQDPPGQEWVRGLEVIAKSRGVTVDAVMETEAGARVVSGYYKSVGDTLNAQRWQEQAARIAARQASG